MIKPSLPKGTRDFLPIQVQRRTYIFNTIRSTFEKFGYQPIETPAMENLNTLTGKYGEEGDRLIFKLLNSGDYLAKADEELIKSKASSKLIPQISEKALRYDLTVPFARFVVQHKNDLEFPFKRYQIQPVWRADRPQKGRYREFYQCDADVIGSDSLLYESEMIQLFDRVFAAFQLKVSIQLNNRKILKGIAEVMGAEDKFTAFAVSVDKLAKIGPDKVIEELEASGISAKNNKVFDRLLNLRGSNSEKIAILQELLTSSQIGVKGLEEIIETIALCEASGDLTNQLEFEPLLARGLDYYTGAIFEVVAQDYEIGSLCGGGRYDDLTGIFGSPGLSGVGISFGVDRIYDAMEGLELFDTLSKPSTIALFVNFGTEEMMALLPAVDELRNVGIAAEMYPEAAKMKKQMKYADNKSIPFVILAGSEEISEGLFTLKDMTSGIQEKIDKKELIQRLAEHVG